MRIYHNITEEDSMVKKHIFLLYNNTCRPFPPFANFTASTTLSTCAMCAIFPSSETSIPSFPSGDFGDSRSGLLLISALIGRGICSLESGGCFVKTIPVLADKMFLSNKQSYSRSLPTQQLRFLGRGMSTGEFRTYQPAWFILGLSTNPSGDVFKMKMLSFLQLPDWERGLGSGGLAWWKRQTVPCHEGRTLPQVWSTEPL